MNIVSRRGLEQLISLHPETRPTLARWYSLASKSRWEKFEDVRATIPSVDRVGEVLIFNVMGGNFRLIATVGSGYQRLYLKALLTHKEYDRQEWMKWA